MPLDTYTIVGRGHLLKGAAALGALADLGAAGIADAAETQAVGTSPVGAWLLTTQSGGNTSRDLAAFTKDGLIIDGGGVSLKAPPMGQNTPITIGLGIWAAAPGGGVDVAFASLSAGTDGSYQGTVTITAHVVLDAAGDTFKGPFKISDEAGGRVVYAGTGSVTATRIKPAM